MNTQKVTAESLKVCRLADIAELLNNTAAERDEALAQVTALRAALTYIDSIYSDSSHADMYAVASDMVRVARAALAGGGK